MSFSKWLRIAPATFFLVLLASDATALTVPILPDPYLSSATSAPGTINITPGGHGLSLADEGLTVQVTIVDTGGMPVPSFPFMDLWLDDSGTGDISLCPNGCVADTDTDANGRTTISRAACGGGWTVSGLRVWIAGDPIMGTPALDINVNSPDLNGDLVVDILDLANFAIDYADPTYNFRSDMTCDGIENIADIGEFAMHYGETCP